MADLYNRLRTTADKLLTKYGQGTMIYQEPDTETGPEYNPVLTPGAEHPVSGIKVSGNRKNTYIDGGYIQASDLMVMLPEFGTTPTLSGKMKVNGTTYQIIMVDPITEEVPTVGWYIGCRV
jgi:hypothetical protein